MPPQSDEVTGSVDPQLSKICTSYSPCRYTPELEPLEIMNSRYSSMSPNFWSVTKLTVRPLGPFRILAPGTGPGTALRRVGPNSRSHRMPVVVNHWLLRPCPCQPARSFPSSSGVQPSSKRNGASPCMSPSFSTGLRWPNSDTTTASNALEITLTDMATAEQVRRFERLR